MNLMGTSAWYARAPRLPKWWKPLLMTKQDIPGMCLLTGEYGLKDVYLGVPVKLGRRGIEEVIEVDLNKEEKNCFMIHPTP